MPGRGPPYSTHDIGVLESLARNHEPETPWSAVVKQYNKSVSIKRTPSGLRSKCKELKIQFDVTKSKKTRQGKNRRAIRIVSATPIPTTSYEEPHANLNPVQSTSESPADTLSATSLGEGPLTYNFTYPVSQLPWWCEQDMYSQMDQLLGNEAFGTQANTANDTFQATLAPGMLNPQYGSTTQYYSDLKEEVWGHLNNG
ncbi:hypothetical protein K469DRAFT_690748 [Zopfia rhizophila CBS 207.26]|uniref:Uncharacterized protein n=1 Tax=Zopfia rhizophila CBS 207.26 TaxID=1314779 RepID=A0A6A6DV51_9PEZI|nr:hypothetical protein K469DRAFT_690748 [Zopfia rhizophila CBS 207.26]